ncbi:MAG: FlgD immunoglobulin-like domain containing protein [Kiritimatiellia bacterium]
MSYFNLRSLSCLLVLLSLGLRAQQSNNTELLALPAPGTVVIDGKLDDWDLSGSIFTCYDVATLKERASAWSAAMFDDKGVYISIRWADQSPMYNMVNPNVPGEESTGWKGDCLQMRFRTDVDVHLTCWYSSPTGKPAMHIYTGDIQANKDQRNLTRALEHGCKLAFYKNADGKGYVQELFLPWVVLSLSGKQYKAGDALTFGMQFMWGAESGRDWPAHNYSDVVSGPTADRICFWYNAASWGKLTLSPRGHVNLPTPPWVMAARRGVVETYGPFALQYSVPKKAKVTLVIEDAAGKRVRNLIANTEREAGGHTDHWDGLDDAGQPVPPGMYHWRGLFHYGITPRYMLNAMPHTNPPWKNATGTGGWGADHAPITDVAADRDRIYLLYTGAEGGSAEIALDRNGNKLWGHGGSFQGGGTHCATNGVNFYFGATTLTKLDAKSGRAMKFSNGDAELDPGLGSPAQPAALDGLAVSRDCLYASRTEKNLIRVIDLSTAKPLRDLTVPKPGNLAVDAAGQLYAITDGQVARIDVVSGAATPLSTPGVEQPLDLAVATDGTLHVLDGKRLQVLGFRGGKLVRTTGSKGGRAAMGLWNRDGIYQPVAVAADVKGDVWVAEGELLAKRLAHFGPNGKCDGEFFGSGPYGGDGIVDRFDKRRIYADTLELRVDWKTGKARPYAVWAGENVPAANSFDFFSRHGKTTEVNGHRYLALARGLIFIDRNGSWIPCAAVGHATQAGSADFWSDLNEDGKLQLAEVVTSPIKFQSNCGGWGWSSMFADDLTAYRLGTYIDAAQTLYSIKPSAFSKTGVPIYTKESIRKLDGTASSIAAAGDFLVNAATGPMTGYDRTGAVRWTYPQPFFGVHSSFAAPLPTEPGQMIGSIYVMGQADMGPNIGTIFMTNGYYGQRHLLTTDGLFVASLFPDGRMMPTTPTTCVQGMDMSDVSPGGESFGGSFDRNIDGNVYLTGSFCGGPMLVVTRIDGLNQITRLPGAKIDATAELIAKGKAECEAQLTAQAAAQAAKTQKPLVMAKLTPAIDGDLADWPFAENAVAWQADATRQARAALAYDDKNLYVAFRVTDRTPWVNNGEDAKVQYITGDSVDIQLALDPNADPKRAKPIAGDLRLCIAPQKDKTIVMLYQPVVAGFTGTKVPFISPTGREDLDRAQPIEAANVVVKRGKDEYVVEASIPLAALGLTPKAGQMLRGDVGALYGDNLGTNTLMRMYWSNKDTNICDDLPSETRLMPGNWGTIMVR